MSSVPPAGVSPASAFVVAEYPPQLPPLAILADSIDAITGDYASLLNGRGLADAMMIDAMRIHRGTGAAVRDVGNRFRELTHIDATVAVLVDGMAREAAVPAAEAGVARLVRVVTAPNEQDPSQLDTFLEYRDLLAPAGAPTRRLVFPR